MSIQRAARSLHVCKHYHHHHHHHRHHHQLLSLTHWTSCPYMISGFPKQLPLQASIFQHGVRRFFGTGIASVVVLSHPMTVEHISLNRECVTNYQILMLYRVWTIIYCILSIFHIQYSMNEGKGSLTRFAVHRNFLKSTKEKEIIVLLDNHRDPHKPVEKDVFWQEIAILSISGPVTNLDIKNLKMLMTVIPTINKPAIYWQAKSQ